MLCSFVLSLSQPGEQSQVKLSVAGAVSMIMLVFFYVAKGVVAVVDFILLNNVREKTYDS
jgi:hypothetical protein